MGAVLLVSRACHEALDGWDESYFLYSEETDFAARPRRHGFVIWYEPAAVAVHIGAQSGTSDRTHSMQVLNRVRYYTRRHRGMSAWCYYGASIVAELSKSRSGTQHRAALRSLVRPASRPDELACGSGRLPVYVGPFRPRRFRSPSPAQAPERHTRGGVRSLATRKVGGTGNGPRSRPDTRPARTNEISPFGTLAAQDRPARSTWTRFARAGRNSGVRATDRADQRSSDSLATGDSSRLVGPATPGSTTPGPITPGPIPPGPVNPGATVPVGRCAPQPARAGIRMRRTPAFFPASPCARCAGIPRSPWRPTPGWQWHPTRRLPSR